jgi:hypothetical protein
MLACILDVNIDNLTFLLTLLGSLDIKAKLLSNFNAVKSYFFRYYTLYAVYIIARTFLMQ